MENSHVTVLEISLSAINHNLSFFKKKLKKETKILAVVKAFGYGSESIAISKYLEPNVDYFAVAYYEEGVALRRGGITKPILVLHPQFNTTEQIIDAKLEPNVYSIRLLQEYIRVLRLKNIENYPIHIKINTGLNRLGFIEKDIQNLAEVINKQTQVQVTSLFSHIAASEDLNEREFTVHQIEMFKKCASLFISKIGYSPFKHMLNTSGIVNYTQEAEFDMVRLGIGLYGFGNDAELTNKLQPVHVLKSVISQIHTVKAGDSVGYNRSYLASEEIKSATIPIGHADGISRQFGKGVGYVYINNQKAPILGNVCMDMLMVNVTQINCQEGDEVFVYKNQNHIEELSKKANTIPYELVTALSQRIRRKLVE